MSRGQMKYPAFLAVFTASAVLLCGVGPRAEAQSDHAFTHRVISVYDEAIRLNPEDAFAIYNRAKAYLELGDKVRAIADFKRASDLGIHGAQVYLRELGVTP